MDVPCSVEWCDREAVPGSTGLCSRCYKRDWKRRRGINVGPPRVGPEAGPRCQFDGCNRVVKRNGYCRYHVTLGGRESRNPREGKVRVEVVVFNGITFRRYPDAKQMAHRRYYKPSGSYIVQGVQALHQEIWKANNGGGPIPEGWHVHHANHDYSDNRPENLVCLPKGDHHAEHFNDASARGRSPKQLAHLARIRASAAAWHSSPEGREWHVQHAHEFNFGSKGWRGPGPRPVRARVQPADD